MQHKHMTIVRTKSDYYHEISYELPVHFDVDLYQLDTFHKYGNSVSMLLKVETIPHIDRFVQLCDNDFHNKQLVELLYSVSEIPVE